MRPALGRPKIRGIERVQPRMESGEIPCAPTKQQKDIRLGPARIYLLPIASAGGQPDPVVRRRGGGAVERESAAEFHKGETNAVVHGERCLNTTAPHVTGLPPRGGRCPDVLGWRITIAGREADLALPASARTPLFRGACLASPPSNGGPTGKPSTRSARARAAIGLGPQLGHGDEIHAATPS